MSPTTIGFLVGSVVVGITAATVTLTNRAAEVPHEIDETESIAIAYGDNPQPAQLRSDLYTANGNVDSRPTNTPVATDLTETEAPTTTQDDLASSIDTLSTKDPGAPASGEVEPSSDIEISTTSMLAGTQHRSADSPPDETHTQAPASPEYSGQPDTSHESAGRLDRFWGPFNVERRAHSFANHLGKLIGHAMRVEQAEDGFYIAFEYANDEERLNLRQRITDAGLEPH